MPGRSPFLVLLAFSHPALAQQAAPPAAPPPAVEEIEADEGEDLEGEEIVVTAQRQRGAVVGDIPPEITLDRREVRALGAGSVAELLDALAPQTRSGRGRGEGSPVVLLNGRRISGFSEIRDLPPEAIDRVDILAEEVALKYGFRADQRVVNIVLRRRFRATTAEVEGGAPTEGGRSNLELDLNHLRVDQAGRWSLDAEYRRDSALFESEREIERVAGSVDDGAFRTLLPQVDRLTLGGTLNRTLFEDVSATLDARLDATDSVSRFGLRSGDTDGPALTRDSSNRVGRLGLSMNGDFLPWRWTFTGSLDRNRSASLTDRNDLSGVRDRARSVDQAIAGQFVANGPLLSLPAGSVSASVRVGAAARDFSSDSDRLGVIRSADLSRDRADAQANLDIPLTSTRDDVLAAIGTLSANLNLEVERLSDFGTLTTYGYGLNWQPIEALRLLASVTEEEGAPSVQQLGDPLIEQPFARVFDFTRGETVLVTRLDGGNAALVADNRRVFKLGATVKPLKETDLTLRADYTKSRTRDVISGFPAATAEIEAAFPDRFTRDASGTLLRIDNRPVNFARSDREELRWGFNYSRPLGAEPDRSALRAARQVARAGGTPGAQPGGQAETRPRGGGGEGARGGAGAGPRGGGGRFGGGGFGRGGGFGGRGPGNLQIGLFHTWRFEDTILIREGVPELDLLDGLAVGGRGGRPRHEVELQAGAFKNGLGVRFTGNYQTGTRLDSLGAGTSSVGDLTFGAFSTFNLRLFADLGAQGKLVRSVPALRGTRVTLAIDNILDSRLRVRDAAGLTPLNFQDDLIDPIGRSVRISLRKVFFPTRGRGRGLGGR
ncbi:MAG TPA: TonB-dependent receptor [Sphingomonadaceae bacterium]|nr:TonB-dependent receptor [Sphingomonadaceae bacterium]